MRRILSYLLASNLMCVITLAQTGRTDSLLSVLSRQGEDTNRVNTLMALAYGTRAASPVEMATYAKKALALSEKLNWERGKAKSTYLLASSYYLQADYQQALNWYSKAAQIAQRVKDKPLLARIVSNIGLVYDEQGNYPKALEYYYQGLTLEEEIGDKEETAITVGNIGSVYWYQGNNVKALENYQRALKLLEGSDEKEAIARNYSNIGLVNEAQGDFAGALACYHKALEITEGTSFLAVRSNAIGNLGNVYHAQADTSTDPKAKNRLMETALKYTLDALKIKQQLGNKLEIAIASSNVADIYLATHNLKEARKWFETSLAISSDIGDLEGIKSDHYQLSDLYSMQHNYGQALMHYKKYVAARDSIYSEENTKKQTRLELQYEFTKKELQAKALQERRDAIAATEKKRRELILFCVSAFGLLVLLFAVFAYRSFLQKKKANREIVRQKNLIEEKQKEILDSIHYARRIQNSLLPAERHIERSLNRLRNRT